MTNLQTSERLTRGKYWQAQGLIHKTLSQFQSSLERADVPAQRHAFYRLASYHARTLNIFHSAQQSKNEALATATLYNLSALHRALGHMYRESPDFLPIPMVMHEAERDQFLRDLIVRVLQESSQPLTLETLSERVGNLDMLGTVTPEQVARFTEELRHERFVIEQNGLYERSARPYPELDWNFASLRALLNTDIHDQLQQRGYVELTDLDNRPDSFLADYNHVVGFTDDESAKLLVEAARTILRTTSYASTWHAADIIHSPYPRPYQRAALSAIQHSAHRGKVVDAPTGSGKTFIGMMCIQDWLRTLDRGQSILIVVPTSNYLQQWTGELCYNPIGLQLSPELIFAGTPARLYEHVLKIGEQPAIVLTTYAALAQFGSPSGKGGFDAASLEMFLQGAKFKYVILDEVHKGVENMHSVSTQVIRLMMDWVADSLLYDMVGLSGTVQAYQRHFDSLGMEVVYSIPTDDLIAAGFVAPYAEFGVPFSYSSRERRIRARLDDYKTGMVAFFQLLGGAELRRMFAAIPLEERLAIGHDILGMYRGRRDWTQALERRFADWEAEPDSDLSISEARLISILQIARGWCDEDLVTELNADRTQFEALVTELNAIREDLLQLMYIPEVQEWLRADDFTRALPDDQLQQVAENTPISQRSKVVKSLLATTITGLYDGLSEWYMRMGEGRVETIKAIVDAEMRSRKITGTIVFDRGKRIHWKDDVVAPGYGGVAGLFAQMLGDDRFTVAAVLSGEMYLTYDDANPLNEIIASYIENTLIHGSASEVIFGFITQGVDLPETAREQLEAEFDRLIVDYLPTLRDVRARRRGEFNRIILKPLRRFIKRLHLSSETEQILMDRLHRKNVNLQSLEDTFFDYALIAHAFRDAHVGQLEQISGAVQKFFVIPMSGNDHRKQLMYDLTARIVDADEIPINFVIVSNWARTGWNVIKPNLLIDATATRDITAWQQLIGRAIRASKSWTNDCYRLLTILTGHYSIPGDEAATATDGTGQQSLDANLQELLIEIAPRNLRKQLKEGGLDDLSDEQRQRLALRLVEKRNKVTHIYELVKAYGSTIQIEYDRQTKRWQRKEAIRNKHLQEDPPHPFTGERAAGAAHAPFIYVDDPRSDAPESLQATLEDKLPSADAHIIDGWLDDA